MIGGIYLEIPFGDVYKKERVSRIRTNINRLFGYNDNFFTHGNMDRAIVNRIYGIAKESVSKHRGDVRREHLSRSGDLIRSTAMGVFLDGKWDGRLYRFTGGPDHEAEPMSWAKHPDPQQRSKAFMKEYIPFVRSRFTVVIAVTMPYAVRVEINDWSYVSDGGNYPGYALAVLKYGINRIGNDIFRARPDAMNGKAQYGYIFEKTGTSRVVKGGL